ncbi:hypothetical protein TWF696_007971 [Orbilia brochopaga]|uniref:DUF676 domain-containing protein n=1 Tax=Orbilia brochopaga TaxID=3140254 RepID=A0AAV9UQ54_9PEZI
MSFPRRWTHLAPASAAVPNTTNPSLHPYQNPTDTRTSSTASLLPPPDVAEAIRTGESSARTLLCVFVHGFVGDETSFRSFPAHFHELLTVLVQETHVVHTKVYPKFKTRDKLSYAVEDLGRWLSDFESPSTDIILLGHSMGGLLAADASILHPLCRHRILGHVSFDTPFLGIHPGVVKSGLSSLFKPGEKPPPDPELPASPYGGSSSSSNLNNSTLSLATTVSNSTSSSSFTPPAVPPKKTFWQSSLAFMRKHHGEVSRAALAYVNGHLEFSGALLDFRSMKARYTRVRALEKPDINDRRRGVFGDNGLDGTANLPRVRFVNYYTACTGRSPPRDKSRTKEGISTAGADIDPDAFANAYAASTYDDDAASTASPPAYSPSLSTGTAGNGDAKTGQHALNGYLTPTPPRTSSPPRKEKTFCVIPKGEDDCWVKVVMENVDEVGAHCGLFFVNGVAGENGSPAGGARVEDEEDEAGGGGAVYERLLGDVAQRIEGWVMDWVGELRANPEVVEEVYGRVGYY